MDSYGNSGFKGVGRRIETSSLRSNNVRTQKINASGTSQLADVIVSDGLEVDGGVTVTTGGLTVSADGLEVDGGVTVTTGGLTVSADGLTVTGNTVLYNNVTVNGNSRLGNDSSDTVGFYTTNGTAQQTTGVASAVVVSGDAGDAITVTTFDGYTVAQVVRAVRNVGLLA